MFDERKYERKYNLNFNVPLHKDSNMYRLDKINNTLENILKMQIHIAEQNDDIINQNAKAIEMNEELYNMIKEGIDE